MINKNEIRIGSIIKQNAFKEIIREWGQTHEINFEEKIITVDEENISFVISNIEYFDALILNDEYLLKFGFEKIEKPMYINGFQYFKHCENTLFGDFHKEGTWFDGIGTFANDGTIVLNVLCRGNYVCNSISTVHEFQNAWLVFTGEEITIKQ